MCVCVCVHGLYAYMCACIKVFDVCKNIPYVCSYVCMHAREKEGCTLYTLQGKYFHAASKKEPASRREENLATFASTSSFHECTKIVLSIMYLCFNL